jgi:hypothetical protein
MNRPKTRRFAMNEKWWEGKEPLFKEGDGMCWQQIYSRKVNDQWEYVIVVTTDDGELVETISMKDGGVDWENHW